jgi:hypothetical protein
MKNAGALISKTRERHAFGASFAAMSLILLASTLASAQSGTGTVASETWKSAAASVVVASPVAAASPAVAASPVAPASPAAAASSAAGASLVAAVASPAAVSSAGAPIAEAAVPAPPPMVVAPAAGSSSPSVPVNMVATPVDADNALPGTGVAEIPAPNPEDLIQQQATAEPDGSNNSSEVARYEQEQSGMPPEQLRALQQFDSEGELSTPFGMQLREAKRSLKSGEDVDGLLITTVDKNGPAAAAGLHPYSHAVHDALTAAAMIGAVFSGGLAVVVIPAIDYMQVGESYDLIIGVDGSRVTNFLDFQDRMRDLQPGELVYLSVVRNGKRLQVTLSVPANIQQATN